MPHVLVDMLLPPASLGVVSFMLLAFGGRRSRSAGLAALALLVILGQPWASDRMLAWLTPEPTPPGTGTQAPQAVVILSADGVNTTEGKADLEPGSLSLERMRAGAALARRTNLPILVSGGPANGARTTLAGMMTNSLRDDFRLPVRWSEDRSEDTWQNAAYSAALLRGDHIGTIYLVSHGWHLTRAAIAFRRAGLRVVPVAVRPVTYAFSWEDLIPSPSAWYRSYIAMHEGVGTLYYVMRADPPAMPNADKPATAVAGATKP